MTNQPDRLPPTQFARQLRRAMPNPERRLWLALRDRRLAGLKFRRQYSIEPYTVDFACPEKRLIIEVDGHSHADCGKYDERREEFIRSHGWKVVRVANDAVQNQLEAVLLQIVKAADVDAKQWLNGTLGQLPEGLR